MYKECRTIEYDECHKDFKYDLLFMKKDSFDGLIKENKKKSIFDLPMEKIIYSKVGDYIGDGID